MTRPALLRARWWLALIICGSLPGISGTPVASQSLPDEIRRPMDAKLVDEARLSIHRGLQYLKANQNANGSWTDKIGRKVHYSYDAIEGQHVGVTALACIAFVAGGSLPGVGEYGEQVERGLQYVLKNVGENGFIAAHGSRMYSHAFATLFLAEVYGMTGMSDVRSGLKRSVGLIVQAQNEQGGWRYLPGADDADMSITVCQVMALRAAHNSGIHVPKGTIDNAIRYVMNSYDDTYDAFAYQARTGRGRGGRSRTSFALTAAGVTALYGAGVYDDPKIAAGLEYMMDNLPARYEAESTFDYYYGMYYATQAAFQRGGDYWHRWHKRVWRDVIALQHRGEGNWRDLVGPNYATAMACIILQIPYQYLPIFER